jgi:hypothetical protein
LQSLKSSKEHASDASARMAKIQTVEKTVIMDRVFRSDRDHGVNSAIVSRANLLHALAAVSTELKPIAPG